LLAVTEERLAVARLLVYLGADPQIADRNGVAALEHATRPGHDEVARILKDA
jgi:uncharacterized protein